MSRSILLNTRYLAQFTVTLALKAIKYTTSSSRQEVIRVIGLVV